MIWIGLDWIDKTIQTRKTEVKSVLFFGFLKSINSQIPKFIIPLKLIKIHILKIFVLEKVIIGIPVSFEILLCETHTSGWIFFKENFNQFDARFWHTVREENISCYGNLVQNLIILISDPG